MYSAIGMPNAYCYLPFLDGHKRASIWFAALVDPHCLLCAGNEALN